ncbi:TonB-dependent receptor plug domain-containing protein [Asticcacaulis endophyticus]|uniref:Ligand-gated channel n=1 Tax=Asticcacaulis endophyticus TaxID=1395890 RepID=A0A918URY0_9CAUL|nr:TonB-dependent receptor [Asticcacaulis endophyticus]GGZ30920.1 ligand-gated channel [Asticcacaulis endophyticus]
MLRYSKFIFTGPVLLGLFAGTAWAAPDPVAAPDDSAVETVIVTGIRGGVPRTVADSPAPIDVISAEKLDYTGNAEFGEALTKILPSFNFGATHAGVNSIVRPVTNRSLGPAYTLVLVNGKRRHNGSLITNGGGDSSGVNPVDLDLVPTSGISRIEVLKDSAAAQYGSDAVAGVINIQLDRRSEGLGGSVTYGELFDGGGDLGNYKADVHGGFKLGENGGFVHLSADVRKRGGAWWNPKATDINLYGRPANRTVAQVVATSGLTQAQVEANVAEANARNDQWDRDGAHNGNPEIKAWNLGYNSELPLENGLTLYSFGTYGERDTEIGNNLRRPNGVASFTALFPDGYYPLNNTHEYDFQVVAGARGQAIGWDWDYSLSGGKNRNHQFSKLTIKPSLGPTSPTYWPNLATFQFTQWTHNLDVTRGFDWGLATPVQVSAGLEYRIEQFETFAGDELAWRADAYVIRPGDQQYDWNVGLAASPVVQAAVVLSPADEADIERQVSAAYVDLGFNPTEDWYVGLAVRAEHYSDTGDSPFGAKINSRYDFTDSFAIRGTLGTGFRAPSLTQVAYAQTDGRTALVFNPLTNQTELQPNVAKLVTADSVVGKLLGAEPLKAEKSWNAGLGFVWHPLDNLSVTADAFYINIKDRIARTGRLSGTQISAILAANNLSAIQSVEYFINAVDTDTGGVDVVVDYRKALGRFGRLNLNAAFNYSETNIKKIAETPSELKDSNGNSILGAGFYFFGGDKVGELEELLPHTKTTLNAAWSIASFTTNLTVSHYGEYVQRQAAGDDRRFGAKTITDLDVAYAVTERVKLSVGGTNIFDVRPELNGPGSPQTGQGYYGPSPFNPNGGYYYTRVSYEF